MQQRLKVFGGISIETDEGPLTGRAVQRRRLALLALLAAARSRGMSRDRLIAFLWPEANAENGRRFLSDSVYRVNQALGGDAILAAGDELRLDPERLPSDIAEFEDALAGGDPERAARLYRGPFLDGFHVPDAPEFDHWIETERDQRARQYATALETLAQTAEREGDLSAAATWWRRLATADPYNGRVAVRLMRALDAAGERGAALQHARVHEVMLREELDIAPSAEVVALAEKLRRGEQCAPAPKASAAGAPSRVPKPAPGPIVADAEPPSAFSPPVVHQEAPAVTSAARPRRRARAAVLIGAALVVVVAPLATLSIITQRRASSSAAASRSVADSTPAVAVLPFVNLSGTRDDDYFSDGITEELIVTLGRVDGLRVASRTSSFVYKDHPLDVREVGRRLGVANVVEGSVRRSGNTLRITARLVSAANGYEVWSETYEQQQSDVIRIQEEIARSIASKLRGTLTGVGEAILSARPTHDAEAYDLYLKGRFAWHQRTREGLKEAVEYFTKAVEKAPGYARAHAGLADAHAVNAFYDWDRPADAYPKADAAARRAIALDPALAAPRATLGYVLTYYHLDWRGAEREFKQAIAMDPAYSVAYQWYGNLLTVSGRFREAERAFRDAQEADPLSLIAAAALGWSYYFAGKQAAALAQCRKVIALNPNFELAHLWGGMALDELGREAEARVWLDRAVQLSKGSVLTRLALARAMATSASPAAVDSARAVVRQMEARRERGEYVPAYEIGKVYLALGQKTKALEWLRTATEDKSHSRAYFAVDPQLAALRGDPRFEALIVRRRR